MNGFTFMTSEPMLEGKEHILANSDTDLWTLQNGNLKNGLTDRLLIYQKKLDVLGKYFILYWSYLLLIAIFYFILLLKIIEKQRKTSVFHKLFLYPTFMLLLLALTVVTVLLVVQNLLLILIGLKALPLNTRVSSFFFHKNIFFIIIIWSYNLFYFMIIDTLFKINNK